MGVSSLSTNTSSIAVTDSVLPYDDCQLELPKSKNEKRVFDFIGAFGLLLFLLPLIGFIALLALLMQGRPVLIRHMRVGRHGLKFPCFKFRTMVKNADHALAAHLAMNPAAREEWEANHKLKNDPRITPLGAILRKSSVDEIPQLFNIIRGEMSLVGPRPIVEGEVRFYGAVIEKYYRVRPGLTGLWQSSGRSDIGYEERVKLDERYVDEQSFIDDMLILLRTIPAVLKMRGSC